MDDQFTVGIIPHTWDQTHLHDTSVGDKVNIETDIVAKYLKKFTLNP
jgi:riboflavin synthase